MVLIDANAIIRILLSDNDEMEQEAKTFIRNNQVLIRNEIMAEIIYVLLKIYNIEKKEACRYILDLLKTKNVYTEDKEVMRLAINTFCDNNIDFVDSLLYAYHSINNFDVFTYDKKLKKML